jgi:uncharacterized OsmC-like protein
MTFDVIQHTSRLWRANPEQAQDRQTVTAVLEGPAASFASGGFDWRADLPSALGGGDSAPSPTALLLSALAGCTVLVLRNLLAPQLGVTLRSVKATASCESDDRGLLGIGETAADLRNLVLKVEIDSPSPQEKIDALLAVWRQRCPVYLALTQPQEVELSVNLRAA